MDEQRDEKLWQIAKRRADFQDSLIGFVVISTICWAIWFFTGGRWAPINSGNTPWPLWVMFGLGIMLVIKFIKAYKTDKDTLTEKEYERLKNKNQ
ncbi:MAG: 2TM domain-containing protein [Ferruginibacter sp.]